MKTETDTVSETCVLFEILHDEKLYTPRNAASYTLLQQKWTEKKKFEKTRGNMILLKPVSSVGYSTYSVLAILLIMCKEEETQCPH